MSKPKVQHRLQTLDQKNSQQQEVRQERLKQADREQTRR